VSRRLRDEDTRIALSKSKKCRLRHLKQYFCSFWVGKGTLSWLLQS
jgi:hypothetical protein